MVLDESKLHHSHEERFGQVVNYGIHWPNEEVTWLSPIVLVSKKNGKLQICVDFWKLNVATKNNPYILPFIEEVLNIMEGHEIY